MWAFYECVRQLCVPTPHLPKTRPALVVTMATLDAAVPKTGPVGSDLVVRSHTELERLLLGDQGRLA